MIRRRRARDSRWGEGGAGERALPWPGGEGPVESADVETGLGEGQRAVMGIGLGALLGTLLSELGRRARRPLR